MRLPTSRAKAYEENQRQYNLGLAMDAAGLVTDTALRGASLALDATQFGASMAFDISRAKASDQQWAAELEYQRERDSVSDSQWQAAFDYQRERDSVSDIQFEKELEYKYAKLSDDGYINSEPINSEPINYEDVYAFAKATGDITNSSYYPMTNEKFEESGRKAEGKTFSSYEQYLEWVIDKNTGYQDRYYERNQ